MTEPPRPVNGHPRQRQTDTTWGRIMYWWRNLVPMFALVVAFYAVSNQESDNERQAEGRGIAVNVLCGGLFGVEKAGEQILKDELPGTEEFRRPRSAQQKKIAQVYATAYSIVISNAVVEQAGVNAEDVLNEDGTINCDALREAARIARSSEP
jgi:hypothetical protein